MTAVCTTTSALLRLFCHLGRGAHHHRPSRQPAPDTLEFHGQGALIQRILSTIHNNSILLRGGPGCGKTAVLLQLKKRLEGGGDPFEEFFPIFVDLHEVPEDLLFATVANAVTEQLFSTAVATGTGCPPAAGPGYDHRDLTHDIRHELRKLGRRKGRRTRLVLLVDGIDRLNSCSAKTAQRVRSLFMASLDGTLVMVATAVEIDRDWEEEGSPWYNFFEEIELTPPHGEAERARRPG